MSQRSAKALLAVTVFLGATLLFVVQPMVTRSILPWFGGSAAVWTTAVLLFQTLLLGGYLYAHLSADVLPTRLQPWVHLVLLLAAVLVLPVLPPESLKPVSGEAPIWRVLLVLLITAGLPFFILSSTSTLAQAWWSRLDEQSPPYRLYALSNTGSLLGLLAYPAVIEPLIGVREQAYLWSGAMGVFALLSGACAFITPRRPMGARPLEKTRLQTLSVLAWIVWPAISSLLLLALTSALSQRVAPIPFLWVLPLSIYLVSFILCFERPAWYSRALFIPAYMALLLAESILTLLAIRLAIWQQLALTSALLFCGCMICHGELYRKRPGASGLTLYYLVIALGSVVGSTLAAIVAPLLFPARWELHLSLAAIALLALAVLWGSRDSRLRNGRPFLAWFGVGLWASATGLLLWLDASGSYGMTTLAKRTRSFYGEITVRDVYRKELDATVRALHHDGVVHGLQVKGTDASSREPMSYYWAGSGLGRLLRATQTQPSRKIGVVGLGAGAIASWGRDSDQMVFYELDPLMVDVARSEFTYLDSVRSPVEIITGDARLSLQSQPDQQFDLLILDAFSGNALPVHLLSIEAMETYRRHLKPDGIIAIHISNHYLDLEPVIARMAEASGLHALVLSTKPGEPADLYNETDVAILTSAPERFADPLIQEVAHTPTADENVRLWTDDYSNLLRLVK